MEEYGNNGSFGLDRKQMRAVDGKQEIYLEWPYTRYDTKFIVTLFASLIVCFFTSSFSLQE